jgi:hypothetical protein
MGRKRRKFNAEFKAEAVRRLVCRFCIETKEVLGAHARCEVRFRRGVGGFHSWSLHERRTGDRKLDELLAAAE